LALSPPLEEEKTKKIGDAGEPAPEDGDIEELSLS
jgi:hypothetical protein